MLVIRNMIPPTAKKDTAGKSMLDSADTKEEQRNELPTSFSEREKVVFFTWASKGQHQRRHGVEQPDGQSEKIETHIISSHA